MSGQTVEALMMKFNVPDLSCAHCVSTVTRAIKTLDAKARVEVDLASRTIATSASADAAAISQALAEAGYPNHPA